MSGYVGTLKDNGVVGATGAAGTILLAPTILNAGSTTPSPIRITNTFGGQTVTDVTTLNPFNNVTISDPNIGQTETLTVTLSSAANGTLSNLGGGSYNATTGVYTDIGTATAVTTDLDGLVFTPTYYHEVSPGTTVPTTLTVAVTDTAGASASDSATTITTTETASPLPIGPIRGVDYGPSPADGGSYPSQAQIDADMATIAKIGNVVRLYTISNGMSYAVTSAIAHGLQVVPSAYLADPTTQTGQAANNTEIANLIALLNNPATDLSKIPFVDVGSDFLTNNPSQYSYLVSEIEYVKAHIPAGVQVTTSESATTYLTTSLGSQVDLIFPIISPYTLGATQPITPWNADAFFQIFYGQLVNQFTTKNIVVSGIGWPSSGTNGNAVGSVVNEETFWTNFIQYANQNKINYFGFSAFDSSTNTNPDFSGPSWGLYTASGTPKGVVTSFISAPPPVIGGTVAGQNTTDVTALSPFSTVTITDPNVGQSETITITLSAAANGTLSNLGGGSYNATTGVYTDTGAPTAVTAAVDGLVFTPTAHQVASSQTVTTTFTISDIDTAGATVIDSTTTVIATSTGEPLSITGSAAGQTTNDITPLTPFSKVTITDPNPGQTETVTVTLSAPANGGLSNLGGGSYHATTGVYTDTGTAAAVTAALDGLVFTPTALQAQAGQTVTTNFTIQDTDTAGQSASDSATSVITTETITTGLIGLLNVNQQLEMIYIAYFNRAADGGGYTFWEGQNFQAQAAGQSAAQALTNIANAFTPQPETYALYPFLATPNLNLNTPSGQAGLKTFINSVYANLFGRAPDVGGKAYWVGQITSGAVGLGAAALAIANGATGADAIEVRNKIAVALDFTTRTEAAGLGTTTPYSSSFIPAADSVLTGVDGTALNDASVTAGMNVTTAYIADTIPAPTQVVTITTSNSAIDPGPGSYNMQFITGVSPSYSPHSRDSETGMVQPSGIA